MPLTLNYPEPQHCNPVPNPNPLANQLWCIDFLTPPKPLIIPHRLHAFLEFLMPLKNWCSIHARWSERSLKHSIRICGIFPTLKQNFIGYRSSEMSHCIFEIHQLSLSGFSRVYSDSCCCCSFEAEIIKIGQSSHKMYSNNILNFQVSMTILIACTKKSGNVLKAPRIYIYTCIYMCVSPIALGKMRTVSSRFWTRVSVSITYDDNHYTTNASKYMWVSLDNVSDTHAPHHIYIHIYIYIGTGWKALAVSILLYGCTNWTLTKYME